MPDNHPCPECGSALPIDAPEGLCAACLMRVGLMDDVGERTAFAAGSFQPPTPAELARHFPTLEIHELLGQGGMGAVYRARQIALDRVVALKILPPQAAGDPAFAERFTREARAMAKLHHAHIVTVFEFGESNGLFYLVMEYVDGVNLRQAIRSKQVTPAQALSIVAQICDALQYAHEEGIVHRDIKPENILLDRRGRVRIADFGLAKLLRRLAVDITLTASHQVVGTFHYMAPEQIERPLHVDHRADIYSLGVVFYELLTGDLPVGRFKLPSERVAVDARLDDVVLKTLERQPEARYQHAVDVKTDVQSISTSAPPIEPQVSPSAPIERTRSFSGPERKTDTRAPGLALVIAGFLAVFGPIGLYVLVGFWHIDPLVLVIQLASVPVGLVMMAGGIFLQRQTSYGGALAGCIAALLPISPSWVLTAPIGIWALIALTRAKQVNAQAPVPLKLKEYELESARGLLTGPGAALIGLGILDLLIACVLLSFLVMAPVLSAPSRALSSAPTMAPSPSSSSPPTMTPSDAPLPSSSSPPSSAPPNSLSSTSSSTPTGGQAKTTWLLIVIALAVPQLPLALFFIVGGTKMLRGRSRTTSLLASIGAMLPLHIGWLFGFPIGIWALITLLRDDVRALYAACDGRRLSHVDYSTPSDLNYAPQHEGTSVAWIVFLIFLLLLLPPLLLAAVYWVIPFRDVSA